MLAGGTAKAVENSVALAVELARGEEHAELCSHLYGRAIRHDADSDSRLRQELSGAVAKSGVLRVVIREEPTTEAVSLFGGHHSSTFVHHRLDDGDDSEIRVADE